MTRLRAVAALAAVGLVLGACEPTMRAHVDEAREAAGRAPLPVAQYLEEAGRAGSRDLCAAGEVVGSADPLGDYGGETAVGIRELVASAPLDPTVSNVLERNVLATEAIWEQWADSPGLVAARWDEYAVGEHSCADGELYMTVLLRENPTMPGTGRYSSPVYGADQVTRHNGLVYGTAVDHRGQTVDLLLDVYVPPPGGEVARPLIFFVHGGGFSQGTREAFASNGVEYARRGFVVVSIDYRLRPNDTPEEQLVAGTQAIDDAMEAVRWVKANAATYGIDPDRIAALGTSAGGAIVLGIAHAEDPTPGGPLAAYEPTVDAVVSTGAHLTPGLHLIDFEATGAPSMMFHYDQDTSKGRATWDYAYQTCTAIRDAGPPCDFVRQAGSGHTVGLGPTSKVWAPEIGPFVWHHLGLAG